MKTSSCVLSTLTVYDTLSRVVRTITNYVPNAAISDPTTSSRASFTHGINNDQNIVTDTTYNERGFVKSQIDVLGHVTLFGYDDAGRLIKTIQSASQPSYDNSYSGQHGDPSLSHYIVSPLPDVDIITTNTYDAVGNLIQSTDVLGNVTLTGYDALNRPVRVIRNASQPTYNTVADPTLAKYVVSSTADQDVLDYTEYDNAGRVSRTQDVNGNWTLFGYDGLDRLV